MKILSWNVKGLGTPNKCARVKNLICSLYVDIVLLQETKIVILVIFCLVLLGVMF